MAGTAENSTCAAACTAHAPLPIADLADVSQRHAGTWNIVKHAFGCCNENSCLAHVDGEAALEVRFPQGSINPSNKTSPLGGVGWYAVPAGLPATAAELLYEVKFDDSFEPQQGGKLPGLYFSAPGKQNFRGGTGGKHTVKCSSFRPMWRSGWQAEAYVYSEAAKGLPEYQQLPNCVHNAKYGDSLWRGDLIFNPQGWNRVRLRARVNTPGLPDGLLEIEINGTCRTLDSMAWRSTDDVMVSAVLFETFFGGSSERFACPQDTKVFFKNVQVRRLSGV